MERPEDFHGHSLSESDIVALKVDGMVTAHYVDRYAWQELHGFLSDQPLDNAEMFPEDNCVMIDGVINNGKKQPERHSVADQLCKPIVRVSKQFLKSNDELSRDS